jgi:guanine deaminase
MKILSNILNPIDKQTCELLDNHIIEVEKGKILDIYPQTKQTKKAKVKDFSKSIITPGLIDAHTHLPQLPIIGNYGYELMEWLSNYTFPAEIEFEKAEYAKKISKRFFEN